MKSIRAEARRLGIPWVEVIAAYRMIRADAIASREYLNELRKHSWFLHTASTPYKWDFWRVGFKTVWGVRVDRQDYTAIRGWDTLAQEVAQRFPDYADPDRLFDFLLSPYDPIPPAEDLYWRALEMIVAHQPALETA